MNTSTATTKFMLKKTIVTRFTKPALARGFNDTDTTSSSLTIITGNIFTV